LPTIKQVLLRQLFSINQSINQKFKVNSTEHCSHCTE